MELDEVKIKRMLDTITVQPVTHQQNKKTHPLLHEIKGYTSALQSITLVTLLLLAVSGRIGHIQPQNIHASQSNTTVAHPISTPLISQKQATEIKNLVKQVALCEQKHPNTIHRELRKQFSYNSYKQMDSNIYPAVQLTLQNRICSL